MARFSPTKADKPIFLEVPYTERDLAKAAGTGFKFYKAGSRPAGKPPGYAYIPTGAPIASFRQWRQIADPFASNPANSPVPVPQEKNAAAVSLGALGGRAGGHKGGKARARNLTREQLSAIGRKGAEAKQAKLQEQRRRGLDRVGHHIEALAEEYDDDKLVEMEVSKSTWDED